MEMIPLSLAYTFVKDALNWALKRWKPVSSEEILRKRIEWKSKFEEYLSDRFSQKLRSDAIVRDIKRMDHYPNTDTSKRGASPWFRVGLIGTYHNGVQLGLGWHSLVKDGDGWRLADQLRDDVESSNLLLVGYVPYELIASVDWVGDEYYSFPHIYCHFNPWTKEPYESLAYCRKAENPGGHPFYVEVADYKAVLKNGRRSKRARPQIER